MDKAYKKVPFFTSIITPSPKGTAIIKYTPQPVATVPVPAQDITSGTHHPTEEIPIDAPSDETPTIAPRSPFGASIGIMIVGIVLLRNHYKN